MDSKDTPIHQIRSSIIFCHNFSSVMKTGLPMIKVEKNFLLCFLQSLVYAYIQNEGWFSFQRLVLQNSSPHLPSLGIELPVFLQGPFVVRSLCHVWLFVTPRTAARQPSVPFTVYQNLPKFMSIELVMLSNHFILCCPLLLTHTVISSFPSG